MEQAKIGSAVVLVLLAAWIGAAAATFVDGLVFDPGWRAPALVSLGIVIVGLSLYAASSASWADWKRTPYW